MRVAAVEVELGRAVWVCRRRRGRWRERSLGDRMLRAWRIGGWKAARKLYSEFVVIAWVEE